VSLEFVGASSERHRGTFPQLAYPYSLGVWVKPKINTATQCIASLGVDATSTGCALTTRPTGVVGWTYNSSFENTSRINLWPFLAAGDAWTHFLTVDVNATTHYLYCNGRFVGFKVNSGAVLTISSLAVGGNQSANFRYLTGLTEGLTVWNQALSAADAQRLAMRTHPLNVARGAIIACYPDMGAKAGTTVEDFVGGYHLSTVSGTPNWNADSPRLIYNPTREYFFMPVTGGGGAITGTLSVTLGAATLSAAGNLPVAGSSAVTLGAATLAGAGALPEVGTASITLGDVTLAATGGGVALTGTAAITLGAATLAATGSAPEAGTASITLGAATLAAAGALPEVGSASITLGAVTVAGAGALPEVGSLAVTLGTLTLAATGVQGAVATGTLAVTLDAATLAAAGNLPVVGTGAPTLGTLTLAAAGNLPESATLSVTLGALTLSATGIVSSGTVTGTAAITLGEMTLAASNAPTEIVRGGGSGRETKKSDVTLFEKWLHEKEPVNAKARIKLGEMRANGTAALTFPPTSGSGSAIMGRLQAAGTATADWSGLIAEEDEELMLWA
jgi:hypothetical protein